MLGSTLDFSEKIQAISAILTFAAVLASLYLGLRREAPVLQLTAKIMTLVPPPSSFSIREEFVNFSVSNIGNVPVTINGYGWAVGPIWMNKWVVTRWIASRLDLTASFLQREGKTTEFNSQIPTFLGPGQTASFNVEIDVYFSEQNIEKWRKIFKNSRRVKSLQARLFTSFPKEFTTKADGALIEKMNQFCFPK